MSDDKHNCYGHDTPELTVEGLVAAARSRGLRKTALLVALFKLLLRLEKPVSVHTIQADPAIGDGCDTATVYRLLGRLEERGIVRRIGSHERSTHYVLNHGHCHREYLICTECGSVEALDFPCPVDRLEQSIAEKTGYRRLYHELQFFGVCPKCA